MKTVLLLYIVPGLLNLSSLFVDKAQLTFQVTV